MRKLISSLAACVAIVQGADATPEWFSRARFGVRAPAGADAGVWMQRIANSGARYVVADSPDDALAESARKFGLMLLNRADYRNLGQWLPSGSLPRGKDRSQTWEARFGMTDDSGGATSRELIRLLIEAGSKGGNLLLSLPPRTEDGWRALKEIGQWLRVNGESIFDASPSPFDRMPFFGRATTKGNTLYLHLFQWPSGGKLPVPRLQNEILSAELLGTGAKLAKLGSTIQLPRTAPHEAASVVKLKISTGRRRCGPTLFSRTGMGGSPLVPNPASSRHGRE